VTSKIAQLFDGPGAVATTSMDLGIMLCKSSTDEAKGFHNLILRQ
jgi:hypothetical protein